VQKRVSKESTIKTSIKAVLYWYKIECCRHEAAKGLLRSSNRAALY